jgi:hypothetical protein
MFTLAETVDGRGILTNDNPPIKTWLLDSSIQLKLYQKCSSTSVTRSTVFQNSVTRSNRFFQNLTATLIRLQASLFHYVQKICK